MSTIRAILYVRTHIPTLIQELDKHRIVGLIDFWRKIVPKISFEITSYINLYFCSKIFRIPNDVVLCVVKVSLIKFEIGQKLMDKKGWQIFDLLFQFHYYSYDIE